MASTPLLDTDADPEFVALSDRKRRAIDRAFDRGLRSAGARASKRRKLDHPAPAPNIDRGLLDDASGGGFIDDGGGFIDDGGGFIDDGGGFIDDGGGFIDDGGGFISDGGIQDDTGVTTATPTIASSSARTLTPSLTPTARVPLRLVASLLASLGLPSDDDVIAVLRASASGWDDADNAGGKESELAVGRKDFRAVCAALMGADDDADEDIAAGTDSDREEDEFLPSDNDEDAGDEDEDEDGDGEYGGGGDVGGQGPKVKARRGRASLAAGPTAKLSAKQKEVARELWAMLKPTTTSGPGAFILGREEVKRWVRELGEMWSEDEITDMVALFSTQHEGRGLSFEDFSTVMLRAGLV